MKKITMMLLLSILYLSSVKAQNKYDTRKINWGMTMEEVIVSEYPLKPKKDDNNLTFENVIIGNNFSATLIYSFKNKKVSELKYIIYLTDRRTSPATKIPLYRKVSMTKWILDVLIEKGYKCTYSGWRGGLKVKPKEIIDRFGKMQNCNTDEDFLKEFDKLIKKKYVIDPAISFENETNRATFTYNECQNSKTYSPTPNWLKEKDKFNLEDIYLWLEISPNYDYEKQELKNKF